MSALIRVENSLLSLSSEPLFILTSMRSYSSLVSTMLGQHSGLYCLPEVNPFITDTLGNSVDLLQMVRKRTLDGLYRAIAQIEWGEQTEQTLTAARAWVNDRRDWTAVRLMEHFARLVAPARLVEKSPSTVLAPDRIARAVKLFPKGYFLHLTRHPVATTNSIAKITRYTDGGQKGRDPETSWFDANRSILEASGKIAPGRYIMVRGEDLLTDPDRYLSQICDWLGLVTTADDLAAMKRPEESPYANIGPASAPFGNDPNFLRNPRYSARPIALKPLTAPLEWTRDGRALRPETQVLSCQLGYGADEPTRYLAGDAE